MWIVFTVIEEVLLGALERRSWWSVLGAILGVILIGGLAILGLNVLLGP